MRAEATLGVGTQAVLRTGTDHWRDLDIVPEFLIMLRDLLLQYPVFAG
jgi:hypothetical protein